MEKDLPHRLERSVLIQADARTVFRFFTDSARWARWWGAGSSIEPRPGGRVSICYPNGARASGEVLANWACGAGTGTSLFVLAPDGRIAAVVGFQDEGAWEPAAADDGA